MRGVTPRLWGYYFDPATGANYTVQVPPLGEVAEGEVAIGSGIARSRGIEVDDLLSFRPYRGDILLFPVSRLLSAESELLTSDLVLLAESDFRALFNLPPELAVDLAVSVANPRELLTIAEKIVERFPDTRPILKYEMLRTYDAIFDWRGGMMVVLLLVAVCAFLVFAWDKAAGLSAEERREIGILKSIGWETGDVRKTYNQGQPNEFTALHQMSLAIPRQRVTVLKGPSGSGKTTLLCLFGNGLFTLIVTLRLLTGEFRLLSGAGNQPFGRWEDYQRGRISTYSFLRGCQD